MKHHFPLPHCSLAQGIIYLELVFYLLAQTGGMLPLCFPLSIL